MSALLDLDDLIVAKIADASKRPAGLHELLGCLVAGAGLVIALSADGDARAANDLCERAGINLFEQAAARAPLVAMARGRA
ncbi:hypothetical protein H0176_23630 [Methylorubrum populi]|uniref:hypothetical protein n=1 Tax=Methylorubrum rhodesianum TaxID=29427 RepID=UPI00190AB1CD|nr:hypothetical protein [Methylorubrum rhodesianum]MBK3406271.1 hypothetical protein [Methylorubrum rhodesianum]MBY0143235.1 hypothetical protein [Methylorubrum populi]